MSFLESCSSVVKQWTPSQEQVVGCASVVLSRVAKNVSKLAVPIIVLYCLANAEQAEAGGMSYGVCMALCLGGGGNPYVCHQMCSAALAPNLP